MGAINTAIPIVNGVCAADATVNLTNLQTLQQTALPALLSAIKASAMSAEQQNAVVVDITAAKLLIDAFIQAQQSVSPMSTLPSTVVNTVLLPATIQANSAPLASPTMPTPAAK